MSGRNWEQKPWGHLGITTAQKEQSSSFCAAGWGIFIIKSSCNELFLYHPSSKIKPYYAFYPKTKNSVPTPGKKIIRSRHSLQIQDLERNQKRGLWQFKTLKIAYKMPTMKERYLILCRQSQFRSYPFQQPAITTCGNEHNVNQVLGSWGDFLFIYHLAVKNCAIQPHADCCTIPAFCLC